MNSQSGSLQLVRTWQFRDNITGSTHFSRSSQLDHFISPFLSGFYRLLLSSDLTGHIGVIEGQEYLFYNLYFYN